MTTGLFEYVCMHVNRGACVCDKCADAIAHPEQHQPTGHTADLIFFKVAAIREPSADEFRVLVLAEHPQLLDGKEHSYIEIGALLGDQGIALMAMGLGALLGVWRLLTPRDFLRNNRDDEILIKRMAGAGLVTVKATVKA